MHTSRLITSLHRLILVAHRPPAGFLAQLLVITVTVVFGKRSQLSAYQAYPKLFPPAL